MQSVKRNHEHQQIPKVVSYVSEPFFFLGRVDTAKCKIPWFKRVQLESCWIRSLIRTADSIFFSFFFAFESDPWVLMLADVEEVQIDRGVRCDGSAGGGRGGRGKRCISFEPFVKKIKQDSKSLKVLFTFLLCPYSSSYVTACVCSKDRKGFDILKRSFEFKAPGDPGGSSRFRLSFHCSISVGPLLHLLLLSLLLPHSFSHSLWSARAIWSCLITLIRTQTNTNSISAMPNSHSTLAGSTYLDEPRALQGHVEIFQTDTLSVFQNCSFCSVADAQNFKANFLCLWEKVQRDLWLENIIVWGADQHLLMTQKFLFFLSNIRYLSRMNGMIVLELFQ